jgi:Holliday junction resolvase RusA-like endonuclease
MYKFIIPGKPIAWSRPNPSYKDRLMFDGQKKLKRDWAIYLQSQFKDEPLKTILSLDVVFFFEPAIRMAQKKRAAVSGRSHFSKPDLSNLVKFLEDACNGIVFQDDCQITQICAKKIYDLEPRTEFTIMEINGKD